MQPPAHASSTDSTPPSLAPVGGGWHCSHLYYSFDRGALRTLSAVERADGSREVVAALDPAGDKAPLRLQASITSGQKADFGLMLLDPDPLKVDRVHQRLMATQLGPAIVPRWSFVSVTEISEYVQSPEQYAARLVAEGLNANSTDYKARVSAYAERLVERNRERLMPTFPSYRATCFYPMNKKRKVGENWFTLAKKERDRLMIEHAKSGIAFAGRVSQLITVGVGFEDWEWGVTLWASNPEYFKDIVYRMRFDEASARYAEFGPFYTGYVATPAEILDHCQIATVESHSDASPPAADAPSPAT